jgi:hypothetical protein
MFFSTVVWFCDRVLSSVSVLGCGYVRCPFFVLWNESVENWVSGESLAVISLLVLFAEFVDVEIFYRFRVFSFVCDVQCVHGRTHWGVGEAAGLQPPTPKTEI